MPLYIAKSGDLDRCHACLTGWLTHSHLKDSATQLLIKYKSGALVTQYIYICMWLLSVLRHMAAGKPVTRGMTSIGDHNCHSLGCYHIICPDQEVLISTRGTTMKSGYWEQMTIASTQQQSTDAMRSWRIWMFDGIMQRLNYLSTSSSSSNDANVEFSLRGCSKMKSSLWGCTQTPSLFPLVIMSSFGYPPSLVHT